MKSVGFCDLSDYLSILLSGLDTMNPILTIDDKLKLIGEYQETVEKTPMVHEEMGTSEENLFKGIGIVDPNQSPGKELKPVTSLLKLLKFRFMSASGGAQDSNDKPPDDNASS